MKIKQFTCHLALVASISLALFGGVAQAKPGDDVVGASAPIVSAEELILQSIEANRSQIEAGIVANLGPQLDDKGEQLAIALKDATAAQLQAIQNAADVDVVDAILSGGDTSDRSGKSTAAKVGDTNGDYTFTPVTPCRLVDTRNAGGKFLPGNVREYYTYGSGSLMLSQGGVETGCSSPVGEPRGVMLSFTAVPVSGAGTVNAYPANESQPTFGTMVVYQQDTGSGGQGAISSTSFVKTFYSATNKDIRVVNRFGEGHLVIDVVGYFAAPATPSGVEYSGGDQNFALTQAGSTVRSLTVSMPSSGHCIINANGSFAMEAAGAYGQCSITTGTSVDISHATYGSADSSDRIPFALTRGFSQSAGSTTYRLTCRKLFTGNTNVFDSHMTAMCSANKF